MRKCNYCHKRIWFGQNYFDGMHYPKCWTNFQEEDRKKPHIVKCEDGSILCEWIDKNWRMGISIEPTLEDSSWYFIQKRPLVSHYGAIPIELIKIIKDIK